MLEPGLAKALTTALIYGICGSLIATVMWVWNRQSPRMRIDQAAAIGFLVGAAFGAFMGIFQSILLQ